MYIVYQLLDVKQPWDSDHDSNNMFNDVVARGRKCRVRIQKYINFFLKYYVFGHSGPVPITRWAHVDSVSPAPNIPPPRSLPPLL